MQRIFPILILLILFSTGAASQNTEDTEINPKEITSAAIEIEISGKIHIVEGIDEITYRQTFPLENANQKILSVNSTPKHIITTDEQGNKEIAFTWVSPESNVLDYEIKIQLERKSFSVISTPTDTREYLRNNNNITKWDDDIKNKAAEITNNYDNNLIKSAIISNWVHENIEYDLNYSSAEEEARWVFENKKGVCDELSHLLISMARSQNIPVRGVGGFVYDGKKWITHTWTEIYYDGKWIPFDPSYNEMGFVDSTHIIYSRDTDNAKISETIYWKGHIDVDFKEYSETVGKKVKKFKEGVYNEKTETIKFLKTNKTKILDAKIDFYDSEVSEDTLVNATLEIENLINKPIIGTFDVFVPEEINYMRDVKVFYLEPYKKTNLTINFKVLKMPDINFEYFFPVIVETFPYATAEQELSVNPKIINSVITAATDKGVKVNVSIINRNTAKREFTVDTCITNKITKKIHDCKTKTATLEGNTNKTLEFLFEVPSGNYTLSIKANTSRNYDELTREINLDIEDIEELRIEKLFIFAIVFLLLTITGIILLQRQ